MESLVSTVCVCVNFSHENQGYSLGYFCYTIIIINGHSKKKKEKKEAELKLSASYNKLLPTMLAKVSVRFQLYYNSTLQKFALL